MANVSSTVTLSLEAIGVGVAVRALSELGDTIVTTAIQMDKMNMMMQSASGDAKLAAQNMEFVKQVAHDMGNEILSSATAFSKLQAATKGSRLEGQDTKDMFEALSAANTKLGGSAADLTGMINAMSQMASKGKISMEELRGQLGDRLPGTMKLAADAMHMTTAELEKLISTGSISVEEFWIPFGAAINKTFNDGKFESAQKSVNLLSNAWTEMKQNMVDSAVVTATVDKLTESLNGWNSVLERNSNLASSDAKVQFNQQLQDLSKSMSELPEPTKRSADEQARYNQLMEDYIRIQKSLSSLEGPITKPVDNLPKKAAPMGFEQFRKTTIGYESSGGADPGINNAHDGGVLGAYQQKQPFVNQWNPGGDVKNIKDQEEALQNFFETTKKKYDGNMAYVFAEYIAGSGNMAKASEYAKKNHVDLIEALEKTGNPKSAADATARAKSYYAADESPETQGKKAVRDQESRQKELETNKKQYEERITAIAISEHTKRLNLEDKTTNDLIQASQIREKNDVRLIEEQLNAYKKKGEVTIQIEQDMQAQISSIHLKGTKERVKIEEEAAKKREVEANKEKKMASDTASNVQKYVYDVEKIVASSEQNKLKQIQLSNKAAVDAINQRYSVEMSRAKLTTDQKTQIEKAHSEALIAQEKKTYQDMSRAGTSYFDSIKTKMEDMNVTQQSMNSMLADKTIEVFGTMGDSIVDFVNGGKANFKQFAMSIITDIEKMIVKMVLFNTLKMGMSAMGFSSGGSFESGGGGGTDMGVPTNYKLPVQAFADGDVFDTPTGLNLSGGRKGVMGEAGPEAIMPLSRGSDGKLGVKGGGTTQNKSVDVGGITVVVQTPPGASAQQHGEIVSETVKRQMQEYVHKEIMDAHRPGNAMNKNKTIGGGTVSR